MEKRSKARGFFRFIGWLLGGILIIAVVYGIAILLHSPDIEPEKKEAAEIVTPMQAGASTDVRALSALFGARLPYLPDYAMNGQAANLVWGGQTVRKVTLTYNGFTVSAVRPANAASVLLRKELTVTARDDLTLLGMPVLLAGKGAAYCAYFSDEQAAYSVYAPDADEETFLQLLNKLKMTE